MAQSIAYVLSAPYPNLTEASNVGLEQGTRIVYALDSEGLPNEFFGDSKLTFIVYGTSATPYQGDWYAFRLLSDPEANVYVCTITTAGLVSID
jgi:hypothetical protein